MVNGTRVGDGAVGVVAVDHGFHGQAVYDGIAVDVEAVGLDLRDSGQPERLVEP